MPEYSRQDLDKLLLFIQQIVTCHDLFDDEIDDSFTEKATQWLMDVMATTLFVYFEQGMLKASSTCPSSVVSCLTYFLREESGHIFSIENFHEEIFFGTINENVEETILAVMSTMYAPLILKDTRWDENVKMRLFNDLNNFLCVLTDINSKMGSFVILFVPQEGNDLTVDEAILDKGLIKRYENVLIHWISQIRMCLNDMENSTQFELACPLDEHDFWVYKFEVLSGIEEQLKHKNIEHILSILTKSQSLFIMKFKILRDELVKEIEKSRSNAKYLKLLIGPCKELEASEYPNDVPPKLPKIIYLIRVISLNSDYFKEKANTERLFSYLSNEIINYCKVKIDITKILNGEPRFGIKICDMSIDCCLAYKIIFKKCVERLQTEDFRKTWIFDHDKIFSQIDIFIKRLMDIMEICECLIVFGRVDETVTIPPLTFGCYNAKEFTLTSQDIEMKFNAGLEKVRQSSDMILNVYNKDWYSEMSAFKALIKSLEEVVQNLLENAFVSISNFEEALDVLTTMLNFSKRQNLQPEYINKVEKMWSMFEEEIILVNKDVTRSGNYHLACLPRYSGKAIVLGIKLKKLERLHAILESAHYLPEVAVSEEILKMYEKTVTNVQNKIEELHSRWSGTIDNQPATYLSRTLINRSPTHGGLLECNIHREILPILEEIRYFGFIEYATPPVLIQTYLKAPKILNTFNKVVNVVLLHNRILCSLSDKERLLFREHIKAMDRKLSPGLFKLTYNDELTNEYITECLKYLDELQHFVDIYKLINVENVRLFEDIAYSSLMTLKVNTVGSLEQFYKTCKQSRNVAMEKFISAYRKVINYNIVLYEGFDPQNNPAIREKWANFIRKIDALAEYSILNCAVNTLTGVKNLMVGTNDIAPDPFIAIDITLGDENIEFQPSLDNTVKTIMNLYHDLIRNIRYFPRLSEKFEVPATKDSAEFYQVVEMDETSDKLVHQIKNVTETMRDKTIDYVYSWSLFEPIWKVDIDKFAAKYLEKGLEIEEFEAAMMKYFDVANQVMMQDTIVTINFIRYNCSKLKSRVLDHIAKWKRKYKEMLCDETAKKYEKFENSLTTRIEELNKSPTNFADVEAALKLYETTMKETKERENDMAVIRKYFSYLGEIVFNYLHHVKVVISKKCLIYRKIRNRDADAFTKKYRKPAEDLDSLSRATARS